MTGRMMCRLESSTGACSRLVDEGRNDPSERLDVQAWEEGRG